MVEDKEISSIQNQKKKGKGKNTKKIKKENPRKIGKEKNSKNRKKKKGIKSKKKKSSFLVLLDKMCVFCLYHIPDYQQCVKRGSCRCPILSRLFCSFKYHNMLIVVFIFVPYLLLNVMLCMFRIVSCFSYFIYVKLYFI